MKLLIIILLFTIGCHTTQPKPDPVPPVVIPTPSPTPSPSPIPTPIPTPMPTATPEPTPLPPPPPAPTTPTVGNIPFIDLGVDRVVSTFQGHPIGIVLPTFDASNTGSTLASVRFNPMNGYGGRGKMKLFTGVFQCLPQKIAISISDKVEVPIDKGDSCYGYNLIVGGGEVSYSVNQEFGNCHTPTTKEWYVNIIYLYNSTGNNCGLNFQWAPM